MAEPAKKADTIEVHAEKVSGGHLVAKALKNEGIDVIFTLCGGHIIDIYDGCIDEGIKIIDVRHEQVAAHAADGYARMTGKPGCAVVTAGPGTEELGVEHVREPGEWVPVGDAEAGECPDGPIESQPGLHVRIGRHVEPVVEYDEAVAERGRKESQRYERNRDRPG